jgi:hypothetical protein
MAEKIYLMGKLNSAEISISDFASELEERGHEVLAKWWEFPKLPTPYLDYPDTSSHAAKIMADAAYNCSVGILFPDEKILGAAVEFGSAIASTSINPEKKIIVVNPFETRQSIFYTHPAVIAIRGIARVRSMDWY